MEQLIWKPPKQGEWDTVTWHCWETECGRYRAMRLVSRLAEGRKWFAFEYKKTIQQQHGKLHTFWETLFKEKECDAKGRPLPGSYSKEFRYLHTAIEAAEKFHAQRTGEDVESNSEEIVAQADQEDLASVGRSNESLQYLSQETDMAETATAPGTRQVSKFERDDLVAMCESIGLHMAKKWDAKTMLQKLKGVCKYPVEERTPGSGTLQVLMDSVVEAIQGGDKIELGGFDKPKKAPAAKTTKAPSRQASAHAGNGKAPKPKKESGGPSNKETVYKKWIASNKDLKPEDAVTLVKSAVQLTTIRGWLGEWGRGKNLPACAKKS